jgi:acetyltransferase-like isoleucine patch superfamily enzyme
MLREGALPSPLQRRLYVARGYRIAPDVQLAPGVVIDGEDVEIGPGTVIGLGTIIRGRRIRIGRRVDIGAFCFFEGGDFEFGNDAVVREQVFAGGPLLPDSLLSLGRRSRIFQTCFLNPSRPLRIGDDAGVGGRSSIFTHGSWQSVIDGYPVAFEPVTIGRNVWLPWHVFILPGVEIGDNATIGAGSVVNRSIPAGALAAGVPAKVLRGPDEWPRRLEPDAQWSAALSVFEQFVAYLRSNGVVIDREETSEDRAAAAMRHGSTSRRLALVRGAAIEAADDDVVLELGPHSGALRGTRISLIDRVKSGPEDDVTHEVEEFLTRYGIRLEPADERGK